MKTKIKKCTIDMDNFRLTGSGKTKIWYTDGMKTCCCSFIPTYFIYEKNTKYNGYSGYNGYINIKHITII